MLLTFNQQDDSFPDQKKFLDFSSRAGTDSLTYCLLDSHCFTLTKNKPGGPCAFRIHRGQKFN